MADHCHERGFSCFRGSEEDVLARFQAAATEANADAVVRITGDCPLYDGQLLEEMISEFRRINTPVVAADYMSNTLRRTYPRGLDTEIMRREALDRAALEAQTAYQREHVTPYFYQNPGLFRLHSHEGSSDCSAMRWTLDTPDDWLFMEAVAAAMDCPGPWGRSKILELLRNQPAIASLNQHVIQKTH